MLSGPRGKKRGYQLGSAGLGSAGMGGEEMYMQPTPTSVSPWAPISAIPSSAAPSSSGGGEGVSTFPSASPQQEIAPDAVVVDVVELILDAWLWRHNIHKRKSSKDQFESESTILFSAFSDQDKLSPTIVISSEHEHEHEEAAAAVSATYIALPPGARALISTSTRTRPISWSSCGATAFGRPLSNHFRTSAASPPTAKRRVTVPHSEMALAFSSAAGGGGGGKGRGRMTQKN
ncbi:hypothetical protein BDQ17DRAFT_1431077 [Cyathus striatus]|nr:hypothetical protein BDQ17DRAFT_1431077 [Cyathus striatus]